MKRTFHAALATVAAALALGGAAADSAPRLTAKQALVHGLPAPVRAVREPAVSRLIVKFRDADLAATQVADGASRTDGLAMRSGTRLGHLRRLAGGASLVSLQTGPVPLSRAKEISARLAADPTVEYAEPDVMLKRLAVPNEPRFSEWQWNLFAPTATYTGPFLESTATKSAVATGGIDMPRAWDLSGGGSSAVVVAVIDTGIVNHPDLNGVSLPAPYLPAGRFVAGYDFISSDVGAEDGLPNGFVENDGPQQAGRDPDPTDPGDWLTTNEEALYPTQCDDGNPGPQNSSWHGTHMAGIIAATANNGVGIAGIGWNVLVQPIRALGKCGGSLSDIAEAIRWAAGLNVPTVSAQNATPAGVISLSLGGQEACSQTMQEAVDAAVAAGSVVVAATGNEGNTSLISPANCRNVIAVTAHTINGENADYANIAPTTTISAPGGGSPIQLVPGDPTDDPQWSGYYVWSTLLFSPTTPESVNADGDTGAAYGGFKGTSVAAPHVAGVAALIKSILPAATSAQITGYIRNTARAFAPGTTCAPGGPFAGRCGAGLLDAGAALTSATAAVTLPIVLMAPQSQSVFEGQAATFAVSAAGAPPLAYQWRRNGADIPGATGASYTTPALTNADSGSRYSVVVSNPLGSVTSAEATVTVVPPAPAGGGGALAPAQALLALLLLCAARLRRRP